MPIKKWFTKGMAIAVGAAVPLVAISCGVTQNSPELDRQNQLLTDKSAAGKIEILWVEKILEKLYSLPDGETLESQIDKPDSAYFKAAYQAFSSYAQFQLAKDQLFFLKQIATWSSLGIFTVEQTKIINQLTALNVAPSLEQFKILYKVRATKIAEEINKLLLVETYFKIKDEKELAKIFPDFAANKANYDLDYYPLISYVMQKQPIQTWSYNSANAVDLFSSRNKTIATVADFQNLFNDTYEQSQAASPSLLFSANNAVESKLGGFKGLELEKASTYNLKFGVSDLKNAKANSLYGFYPNTTTGTLIQVNSDNTTLASAFPLYNSTTKQLSAIYINQIAPIGKSVDVKDASGKVTGKNTILSFDGTVYKDNLNKLIYILALTDTTLYATAKTAFVTLGYKFSTTDDTLKKTLEGSGII